MKWAAFDKRSTTIRTVVLPPKEGRPMIKSITMCDHGSFGISSGWRKSSHQRLMRGFSLRTHRASSHGLVSQTMDSHQKRCHRRWSVWWSPGWQARWDACPHRRTSDRAASGMNNVSGGTPPGGGQCSIPPAPSPPLARLQLPQWMKGKGSK